MMQDHSPRNVTRYRRVPLLPEERRTILWIRRAHNLMNDTHLTSEQLAHEAGLPLAISYQAEIGGRVDRSDAEKILAAFSRLTGHPYTLKEVFLQLRPARSSGEGAR